jgi:hypothetical protein
VQDAGPGPDARPAAPAGPVAVPTAEDGDATADARPVTHAVDAARTASGAEPALRAATIAVAPGASATHPEPRADGKSAAARGRARDAADATPADGAPGHAAVGALDAAAARPAPRADDARDAGLGVGPATERSRGNGGEPDAGLAARAAAPAARVDPPAAASAAAPTAPARAVAEPPVVEQLVRTARLVLRDGLTEMDVQLAPPSLGMVRVTAAAAGNGLGLTLTAERPETRALLLHAIPEMQAVLAGQGIATASIAVASHFEPPGERRAPARRDPERPSGRLAREAISERPGTARATHAAGAVDLTV